MEDLRRRRAIHVLALGQSNIASHGEKRGESAFGSVLHGGARRPMRDPIPGGSGAGGSVWPRVADALRDAGAEEFLLSLRAEGGTAIADWAPGGRCFTALAPELPRLARAHPPVTHVVFQQGERDTFLGTTQTDYEKRFAALHEAVRAKLPQARWIICRSSYRMGETSAAVTSAQGALAARLPGCHEGPNTDALGAGFRRDDTHFNARGLAAFGDLLASALMEAP